MKTLTMVFAILLAALPAMLLAGNDIRIVEKLPKTEQLESGELSLQRISDRQLVALMLDLVKRVEFDRSQNGGKAGPDGGYLKGWLDKVIAEMEARRMAADGEGLIDVPAEK
jgi:hypothetical protein